MKITEIPWKIEYHTEAKHEILRKYLQAWMVILSKNHKRIIYLDGFAGPGEYINKRGKIVDGSPIIAIKCFSEHILKNKINEIVYIFIEEDKKVYDFLINKLKPYENITGTRIIKKNDEFENVVTSILDDLEKNEKGIAPTFCFIDPFGIKGLPLKTISRIMNKQSCEVLINFMYEEVNRFVMLPGNGKNINALFGEDNEWKKINNIEDTNKRYIFLSNLYKRRLEEECGTCYIRTFDMINKFNKNDYILFFCTKNKLGLTKMKESMWKIDETGEFTFSDATFDPEQKLLFEKEPKFNILKKMILLEYKGKSVSIDELIEFVTVKTPFLESHLRKPVLFPMEGKNEIEVSYYKKRSKATYPKGTIIKFN